MICNKCGKEKNEKFYLRKESGRFRKICIDCWSEISKQYRKNNLDKVKKEKLRWQRENKEKKAVIASRYYKRHKKKVNDYIKKWKREKRSTSARIIDNYRSRIYKSIKRRSKSTRDLIGCDIDFLKEYLSKKFDKGMTWENYGEWHIDHIKPCSIFNLEREEELKKCFNYKNLQPLWAIDNQRKKDKFTME